MTKGDYLFGRECYYKNIKMRSVLETKIAFFLDTLKINWKYEPYTITLKSGTTYTPDFYLPEQEIYIEVKGKIEEHNINYCIEFCEEVNKELILISNDDIYYFITYFDKEVTYSNCLQIGLCSRCNKYFFCELLGSFHCRNCGIHEGDHDIRYMIGRFSNITFDDIDFYDNKSILNLLEKNKSSI